MPSSWTSATGRSNFVADAVALTVTKSIAAFTPPGHYLLFILNGDGVPSVARIVQIV